MYLFMKGIIPEFEENYAYVFMHAHTHNEITLKLKIGLFTNTEI